MTNLLVFLHLFLGREKLTANTRDTPLRHLDDKHNCTVFKDESFRMFVSYHREAMVDIGLSPPPKWDLCSPGTSRSVDC